MKGGLNFVFVGLISVLLWQGSGQGQAQGLRLVHQRDIQLPAEGSKLAFTPDGRHILAGHWERGDADPEVVATNEINFWDVQSGRALRRTRVPQRGKLPTLPMDVIWLPPMPMVKYVLVRRAAGKLYGA